MQFVYILKCLEGRLYVGRAPNVAKRFADHCKGTGAMWTKLYKPISILDQHSTYDPFDEDKFTIKYMASHGVNNVRGGSFVTMQLESFQLKTIEKMITNANGNCFFCNQPGHFASNCPDRGVRPLNYHKKWSRKEEQQLLDYFKGGLLYGEIAKLLGRTDYAVYCRHETILSRLLKEKLNSPWNDDPFVY